MASPVEPGAVVDAGPGHESDSDGTHSTAGNEASDAEVPAAAKAEEVPAAVKDEVIHELEQEIPGNPVVLAAAEAGVKSEGFFARFRRGKGGPPKEKPETVSFISLFRFGTTSDRMLTILGLCSALASGAAMPYMSVIMGDVTNAIISFQYNPPVPIPPGRPGSAEYLESEIARGAIGFTILGCVSFVTAYIMYASLQISAIRQTKRMRDAYFLAILRQDVGWHDQGMTGELTARLTADVNLVQEGIGEKLGVIVQSLGGFLTGFIIAFTRGWQLSLILLCVFPLIGVAGRLMAGQLTKRTKLAQDAYGDAGGVAEQAIGSVRTVQAFSGEQREVDRYEAKIKVGLDHGIKIGFITGVGIGSIFAIMFCVYGLAFWYGSTLILAGTYNGGQVLNVFFALMIGVFSILGMAPNISALYTAQGAAVKIHKTVDRKSPIDPLDPSGTKPSPIVGNISFSNVNFRYPSRPDVQVLENFSLDIKAGTKVALVGSSGSGKSTIVKLLERFYDPESGSITLDSNELRSINVRYLRQQFGIVSQEPTLFDCTIRENVLLGLPDASLHSKEALDELVHRAIKIANADFVYKLPEGLDSQVGERGIQVSGGQKQRIAIARAIISNPPILLLDEATAALDTASERLVQRALDEAAKGRTSIVVAHRLSTIRDSNAIYVMSRGKIVESGTHEELVARGGAYADLVKAQEIRTSAEVHDEEDPEEEELPQQLMPPANPLRRASTAPISIKDRRVSSNVLSDTDTETAIPMDPLTDVNVAPGVTTVKSMTASSIASADPPPAEEKKGILALGDLFKKDPKSGNVWLRVVKLNKPETKYLLIGTAGAAGSGAVMPLWGLIFSSMLTTFGKTGQELQDGARFWALMFLCLGIFQFITFFLNISFFTMSGELLTMRMRLMCYKSILRQNIGWFDDEKQSTGTLTAKLADDATQVKGLFGQLLGSLVQSLVTTAVGIGLAMWYGWKLAFIILATIPIVAFAGYLQFKTQHKFGQVSKTSYEESNTVPTEAISNVRTVATITKEEHFFEEYKREMLPSYDKAIHGVLVSSLGQGFSNGARMFVNALAYWVGAKFMISGEYDAQSVQGVIFTILFMAMGLAQATQNAPSITKAKLAAISIFQIVDRTPEIDATNPSGLSPTSVKGQVNFESVEFAYPTRPLEMILKGLDLEAKPGQTVALVGPSGCGKSTTVGLIERFYDVGAGSVRVESTDVREWNLQSLRHSLAIVSQEPIVFEGTIAENIAYGLPERAATMDEIVAAAKLANIHTTVESLPKGYETSVGEGGALLSGGQKQRVAIARALVRQPKILLLDEATAALDSQSEKVVQAALDAAAAGRTTLSIAHRLSTIQGADMILVFQAGKIVERGKHMELYNQKGFYYELVVQQQLGTSKDPR
ncbi:P-loop containing nucleoside triphosphate hydrolase protein [Hyaloraphidium curvatum]|nr:P-loop containing nucleoside triphosphate hydrolase protein [Hyaloraphidium curvatum]